MKTAVLEFLTAQQWDDHKPRQTGTIMLLAEQGRWKAWLHDRAQRRSCWVSALDLEDLLHSISEVLVTGAGDWRADKR